MEIIFIIGRVLLGGYFIYSGFGHFKNHKNTTTYAKMKGVPMASVGVIVSGALMFLGGLAVLLDVRMELGLWLIVIFLVPTTFIMHQFWKVSDPMMKMGETINFTKNIALIGSALMLIAMTF